MSRELFTIVLSTCAILPLVGSCQWKDCSTPWEKLSDVKETHPLQMAEYAISMGVFHKPGFNWWVLHMLRKRDSIIALVKKRSAWYLKCTHKFGIECPKTVEDALELDKHNGNTMWADAIGK